MNREEAKQLTETALQDLALQLKRGQSEQLRAYLDAMAKFHRYSFGHVLLITMQMPAASRVAGFHSWRKLGRWVRQGEKGIAILAPMVCRPKQNQADQEERHRDALPHQRRKRLAGFRIAHVFDISQTEGTNLPQFARVEGDVDDFLAKLNAMVAGHGITLAGAALPAGVQGASTGGRILLRPDLTPAQAFAVLVHEYSHELLHRNRRGACKTVLETEAEAIGTALSPIHLLPERADHPSPEGHNFRRNLRKSRPAPGAIHFSQQHEELPADRCIRLEWQLVKRQRQARRRTVDRKLPEIRQQLQVSLPLDGHVRMPTRIQLAGSPSPPTPITDGVTGKLQGTAAHVADARCFLFEERMFAPRG